MRVEDVITRQVQAIDQDSTVADAAWPALV
jgi:hypothetical protein